MAIYIDNEKLNLKGSVSEGTDHEVFVKKAIADLKQEFKGRFPLIIQFGEHLKFIRNVTDTTMGRETRVDGYPAMRKLGLNHDVTLNGVKVNIQYAEKEVRNADGEFEPYPRKLSFNGKLMVGEHDVDLAFFLLYCTSKVNSGRTLKGIDKLGNKSDVPDFVFIDTHKENIDEANYYKVKSRVEHSIMESLDDEKIKSIAIHYGIAQATNKPAGVLRPELVRYLNIQSSTSSDKTEPYNEFNIKYEKLTKDGDNSIETKIRKYVQLSIEKELVRTGKIQSGGAEWMYKNPKSGARGKRIMEIDPNLSDIENLVQHLLTDEDAWHTFEKRYREYDETA